jgi:hypothetical protein
MFRKLILAAAAGVVLAAAALAPTAASASWHGHGHGHGYGHGYGFGFYAPVYAAASDCYVTKRLVRTPYGPRWRRVTVCD